MQPYPVLSFYLLDGSSSDEWMPFVGHMPMLSDVLGLEDSSIFS
jgi:hypothetical protein